MEKERIEAYLQFLRNTQRHHYIARINGKLIIDGHHISDTELYERVLLFEEVKEYYNGEHHLSLDEYQAKAMSTCTPESANFAYMFGNLVGEVGELSSKVAKAIRKGQANIKSNQLVTIDDNLLSDIVMEGGDVLWQLSSLFWVLGFRLSEVARRNLTKLADRKKRGVIVGDGDNR